MIKPTIAKTPTASPVFDTLCSLSANMPNSVVMRHEHQINTPSKLNKKNIFYIFSYRQDFDRLWENVDIKFGEFDSIYGKTASASSYSTIIVWDGYPENNRVKSIPIENWVTPVDWAVCAALSFNKQNEIPNWRVLVIDLVSQNYPGVRSVSLLKDNPAMIPWLRIYRPLISKEESELNQFDKLLVDEKHLDTDRYALLRAMTKDDFTSLIGDIGSPERILGLNDSYETLEALASIWCANMVRPGDRHQVANLVAPLILLEALKNRANPKETMELERNISNSLTLALTEQLKMLQLMGLPRKGKGNKRERALRSVRDGLSCLTNEKIDFQIYLIDDQYRVGYLDILNFIVEKPNKVLCKDSASDLFDNLKVAFERPPINTPGWRKPLFGQASILLLDLRLWYEKSAEQLVSFYDELTKIAALYEKNINEPYEETVNGVKVVLDEQRKTWADHWNIVEQNITDNKDKEDLLALTLLPRLLSIVDPFLPIIIFSSSAQRQTLEAFASYPNIITDFRKPMPTGYGASLDPMEGLNDLATAFTKAVQICRLKFIGDYISDLDQKLFIDGHKIAYEKFKNKNTSKYDIEVEFSSTTVSTDLKRVAMKLLQGNYRFSTMLPFSLMERWYNNATKNVFEDVMPNKDYWLIANPRNDFVHSDLFCLESDPTDIEKTIAVWKAFLEMLKIKP